MYWSALIPVRSLPIAKSRLLPASSNLAAHSRLVAAIRADTINAVLACASVARVICVYDRSQATYPGTLAFQQSGTGLNAALAEAATYARSKWPDEGTVALVCDLPALRPRELTDALACAANHRRSFVADTAGTGTTMLAAQARQSLLPQFGIGSAARHGRNAVSLPAGLGLRLDVDTAADLRRAVAAGPGTETAAVLALARVTQSPSGHGMIGP